MAIKHWKTAALIAAAPALALAAPATAATAPAQLGASAELNVFAPALETAHGVQTFDHGRHDGGKKWRKHYNKHHRGDDRYYGDRGYDYDDDDYYDDRRYRDRRYDDRRYRDDRYRQSSYGEPVYRNTRVWRGNDGRYYCRKEDGTTGLLIGGAVGALAGRELAGRGDRTLGTILGAAGGAILGRAIDRSNSRCR